MRLSSLFDGFNGGFGFCLFHVRLKGSFKAGEVPVGLEAPEGFRGFHEAGGGPAQGHLGVPPAFDVALNGLDGAQGVLSAYPKAV